MVPCTVRVIDSRGKAVPDSDYSWHQCANSKSATKPITLVPVPIKPSDSSLGHWVLAVLDSNGVRLLDSLPAVEHTRAATEKIGTLFHGTSTLTGPITEVRGPRASSENSGIAIFWSAVYVIGLSHGFKIHLPETFDPAPWRIAMASFLRATAGQSYNIPWSHDTKSLTVTLGDKQIVQRLLSSFSTGTETLTINPDSFIEDLRKQISLTEQAKKDVKVKKTGVLRSIHMFLGGLMEATAKEKALLEMKEKDYQACVEKITEIEKFWGESKMARLAHENVQQVQACEGLRKDMAVKTSKVVEDLDHGIKELENT
ncbi:hypothetical protein F5883DRAFT_621476 [Diaporthe sp. PMI_573]|nr:hypothetical protein F5883DRAFT_586504 [Diaporthaceae sp. PMI_573]KAH8752274.1 hypothetical protein F5883DRAFT_621476 [Diaporthaceae sp. PMI_573]